MCGLLGSCSSDLSAVLPSWQAHSNAVGPKTPAQYELLYTYDSPLTEHMRQASASAACLRRFEWVDGVLTRAIEQGGWVLLESGNLCNPAVLDRLNSLLEPGGGLLLNEAGTTQGQARLLRPHPDFRLFMTMNARCGALN